MRNIVAGIFACTFWTGFVIADQAHANETWLSDVMTNGACPLQKTMELAEILQTDPVRARAITFYDEELVKADCIAFPPLTVVRVYDVIAGPLTDHEGDPFYVVRITQDHIERAMYTFAWPGHNAPSDPRTSARRFDVSF